MPYKYKLADDSDFFVPGVGQSVDGVITSHVELEGGQYILVEESSLVQGDLPPVAAQGAVIGVAPQATQSTPQPVEQTTKSEEQQ